MTLRSGLKTNLQESEKRKNNMELDDNILEELRAMKVGKHIKIFLPEGDLIDMLDELYLGYKLRLAYACPLDGTCIFQKTQNIYGDYVGFDAVATESYLPH